MAEGSSSQLPGGDRRPVSGLPSRRKGGNLFTWSASSPSPADVSGLEALFPDVIQLPVEIVDRETEVWDSTGLIVRSLSRWVPPDAVIREFRRAGIVGRIDSISLAHRISLMKLESPEAKGAVLRQPWVVNGQPLAIDNWRPDFVAADDAVSFALIWIRLPNLPMEYWNEETIGSILSVAGEFIYVDEFTKERRRGSFARAAVRVDLRKPLRPGARIRARGSPFGSSLCMSTLTAYAHTVARSIWLAPVLPLCLRNPLLLPLNLVLGWLPSVSGSLPLFWIKLTNLWVLMLLLRERQGHRAMWEVG